MPTLHAHASLLPEITGHLRALIDRIAVPSGDANRMRPVTPEDVADLLTCLMRAGESLRSQPSDDPDARQEAAEYRMEVQRLHGLLPSIHSALLAERSRLEHERERLRAAAEWACSSRDTL